MTSGVVPERMASLLSSAILDLVLLSRVQPLGDFATIRAPTRAASFSMLSEEDNLFPNNEFPSITASPTLDNTSP